MSIFDDCSKPRIVIIEDDEIYVEFLYQKLKLDLQFDFDFIFMQLKDLKKIEEDIILGKIDLLIIDYLFTGELITGEEILKMLREIDKDIPIVVLSGYVDEKMAINLLELGADDCILKLNSNRLVPVIKNLLERYKDSKVNNRSNNFANAILLKLSKTINWILQNSLSNISLDKIVRDYGKLLRADRSYILEKKEDQFIVSHQWADECILQLSFNTINELDFPILYDNNKLKQVVNCITTEVSDERSQKLLLQENILSIASVPILNPSGDLWGYFVFDDCKEIRSWSELELSALRAVGSIFGTIIYKMEEEKISRRIIEDQVLKLKYEREKIEKLAPHLFLKNAEVQIERDNAIFPVSSRVS